MGNVDLVSLVITYLKLLPFQGFYEQLAQFISLFYDEGKRGKDSQRGHVFLKLLVIEEKG